MSTAKTRIFDLFLPESSISYEPLGSYAANKKSGNVSTKLKSTQVGANNIANTQAANLANILSQARNSFDTLESAAKSGDANAFLKELDQIDNMSTWWNSLYKSANGSYNSDIYSNLFGSYQDSYPSYQQDWSSWFK